MRGSHLIINKEWSHSFLLQAVSDNRVIFVLPYKGKMLLGTTEVIQSSPNNPQCSNEEMTYLINEFNEVFRIEFQPQILLKPSAVFAQLSKRLPVSIHLSLQVERL